MGFFTIPLAKLTGKTGKVIAADLQPEMLAGIQRRARKAGVDERIILHQCTTEHIGVKEAVDFCLAFWMVHEVPDRDSFFREIASLLKPGGCLLMAEPKLHVSAEGFKETLKAAVDAGLRVTDQPHLLFSFSALLKKPG